MAVKRLLNHALLWSALAMPAFGCVSSGEGEAMRTETARLKDRLDKMDARYADAIKAMDRLRQVVDEANALLARNSADVGARVEQQEQDLRALQGKFEEARHAVEQLQKRVDEQSVQIAMRLDQLDEAQQKLIEKVSPTMPTDKDELWKQANQKLNEGQRDEARRLFKSYISRFPTEPRAATARLAIGKSYALDNDHRQAAGNFQKLLDDYPRSEEVAEAMFELGRSFIELKFCGDARAIFTDVAKRFPRSPQAKQAKVQAEAVKKILKDPTRCTS